MERESAKEQSTQQREHRVAWHAHASIAAARTETLAAAIAVKSNYPPPRPSHNRFGPSVRIVVR